MAQATLFKCTSCDKAIESWSDGNPYYIDEKGQKHYAYHPDTERLSRCIGNDDPHLCLDCGEVFMVDTLAPIKKCPECNSSNIKADDKLEGQQCPYCKQGVFKQDPDYFVIS